MSAIYQKEMENISFHFKVVHNRLGKSSAISITYIQTLLTLTFIRNLAHLCFLHGHHQGRTKRMNGRLGLYTMYTH